MDYDFRKLCELWPTLPLTSKIRILYIAYQRQVNTIALAIVLSALVLHTFGMGLAGFAVVALVWYYSLAAVEFFS